VGRQGRKRRGLVCCSSVCAALSSDICITMTGDDEFSMNVNHPPCRIFMRAPKM
jgi:hypothetical protein